MCPSRSIVLVIATCVTGAATFAARAQETIEDALPAITRTDEATAAVTNWLERHDLTDLLAVHLEQQIDASTGEQQRALILRLAGIYSELLERADDPDRRAILEVRARRLLTMADVDGAEELRLSLLRASYRSAEKVAEQHRLRLATDDDVERARRILTDVAPQLQELNQQLERSVMSMDRQLSRASGAAVATISSRLERVRMLHQQCNFLTAWALYHNAWLNDNTASARAAEEAFAKLLMTESPRPQPDEVSIDLRATEAYARSILGMALCKSLTASSGTALRWIELLETESTYAELREQAIVWKLVIRLDHAEFVQAGHLLSEQGSAREMLPLMWLRLIAVHALEAPVGARGAQQLVRLAVTQLAALGELDQILDLAERYGVEALGESGFALRYVNGLMAYRQARDAHPQDGAAIDDELLAMYQQAIDHLTAALAEPDADQYPAAIGACRRLQGWALYFQGRYVDAHDAFLLAESQLPPDEAAEALWMAIVCLDDLIRADGATEGSGGESIQRDQAALSRQFIAKYPTSDRVPSLLLRQAIAAERVDDDTLQQLMNVPPSHDSHDNALRRAAQELYQRFREASGSDKSAIGLAFLNIAGDLLERGADNPTAVQRLVLDIRRVLEVALNPGVQRAVVAQRALQRYEQLIASGDVADDANTQEIALRQAQERLLDGDVPTASVIADQLWDDDPQSPWSRLASRAMFQYAHALRPVDDAGRLRMLARYGGRVIREFEDDPQALAQTQVLTYHAAVADAMARLWEIDGESHHARAALFLYQRMLTAAPRNAAFLRAAAGLATQLDDLEFAADCWRRIAAGSPSGSSQWYEARYELMAVLATLDPQRARQVMRQHVQLYPDYGPEPWGPRMRQLAQRLAASGGGS